MDRRQKDEEYSDSKQGKKALKEAQELSEKNWQEYNFAEAAAANLDWEDLDDDRIGKFEPWLCVMKGNPEDWVDLNGYDDGEERKKAACVRILGIPESCTDEEAAREIIESIDDAATESSEAFEERHLKGGGKVVEKGGLRIVTGGSKTKDFDAEGMLAEAAAAYGFQKNELFSYEDHVRAVEFYFDEAEDDDEEEEEPMDYQHLVDDAMNQQQKMMDAGVEAAKAKGEMDPVNGITIEDWAGANAKIVQQVAMDEILNVLEVDKPLWDEANAEWNDRMTRNFEISKVYADAFSNPDIGKFAGVGPKKSVEGEPCEYEEYVKIQVHMEKGVEQGLDPQSILQQHDKSMSDWTTIQSYWSQQLVKDVAKYTALEQEIRPKYEKEYDGGGVGDDIEF